MSDNKDAVPGGGQTNVIPGVIPGAVATQPIDPQAKAFMDKLMELFSEVYNLSIELSVIDDPNLQNSSLVKQARKVIKVVKEIRDVLQQKK